MNRVVIFLFSMLLAFGARAQVDSIHFQFQDTLLKAGTTHTFKMKVRESISGALGFQFCLQFDPANITFNSINKYYISGWSEDNMNIYPLGNPDLIACAVDVISAPYNGHDMVDFEFNVVNDCRVKDVIRILAAYRFKDGDSYSKSEMFFENDTYPIATEYLPYKPSSTLGIKIENIDTYPNPSVENTFLQFNSKKSGLFTMSVYDTRGQLIKKIPTEVSIGLNKVILSKSQIGSTGAYFINLDMGDIVITSKLNFID